MIKSVLFKLDFYGHKINIRVPIYEFLRGWNENYSLDDWKKLPFEKQKEYIDERADIYGYNVLLDYNLTLDYDTECDIF